ncbi:MAG TPA: 2,3-diketo-5-methylthio-1-phosphopentane phosphatase [Verrucomicrobia bacterium]|nr:2,3-diketo-5-methylthio-1-phosphopentane phosphatase [Verrucomicrobiota bacterium]
MFTGILVSDFDGTMTKYDFFDLARRDLNSVAARDYWQEYVDGKLTHFEALAGIFGSIRAETEVVEDLVDRMELDPQLKTVTDRFHRQGWEVIVASAGCDWYIRKLLDQAGIQIDVHGNPGTFLPDQGLILAPPSWSPFYSRETGIDKAAIVRDALKRSPLVAFAGDGRPDFEPAMLVPPERRFARGWLAHHLEKINERFHPFDSWSAIAQVLLKENSDV